MFMIVNKSATAMFPVRKHVLYYLSGDRDYIISSVVLNDSKLITFGTYFNLNLVETFIS